MKVETKEDALLYCFDLWFWLALNPECYKSEWPGWKENGGEMVSISLTDCFACDWLEISEHDCDEGDLCILGWPNNDCLNSDSFYYKWKEVRKGFDYSRCTKYALEICALALDALFELKGI